MNNFGVIELASTKTTNAPGWAYVPDTGPLQAQSTTNNRKRARGGTNPGGGGGVGGALSSADASARQEAKTRKEIEVLDRDNPRDVQIAVPAKPGRASQSHQRKHTPNVRKILQSQKTFANHLDDYIALGGDSNPAATSNIAAAAAVPSAAAVPTSSSSSRAAASAANASLKKARTEASSGAHRASTIKQEDVDMADVDDMDNDGGSSTGTGARRRSTILTPYTRAQPSPPPPQDQPPTPLEPNPSVTTTTEDNPLLSSRVPPLPTDPELRALLSAPPLSYLEVRALSSSSSTSQRQRYPARVFCEVCGYWGRVRCLKCGARACALDCLEAHREDCVTRYGL
ncbi:hypothetical protein F4775DRAFT_544070 [Biscogniauxia sp. FL1348]|nr:hypothetical protein F4775DRAFT_544070 [Biscogniauxia sp. FL1348]